MSLTSGCAHALVTQHNVHDGGPLQHQAWQQDYDCSFQNSGLDLHLPKILSGHLQYRSAALQPDAA